MLHLLDQGLEAFLRNEVPAPPAEIDISFQRPDGSWGAGVKRPTLNVHLWDVKPAVDESSLGYEMQEVDGRSVRKPPLPRVHFRYMITAWSSEISDEHQLLGAVLVAVLRRPAIPSEYLAPALASAYPVSKLRLANTDQPRTTDFWSAAKSDARAAVDVVITLSVDTGALLEVGPPISKVDVGVAPVLPERNGKPGSAGRKAKP